MRNEQKKLLTLGKSDKSIFSRWFFDWTPHEGQKKWLSAKASQKMLTTGRRWGKSESQAIDLLHYAFYHPGSLQCNISITQDQAEIIFNACVIFAQKPRFRQYLKKIIYSPHPKLILKTGSEIWARSVARDGLYIRGHKFHRVNIDEAAFIKEGVVDQVIRMTLADYHGDLVMTSTPCGRNWFYQEFIKGLNPPSAITNPPSATYYSQTGSSYQNPHISKEKLKEIESELTERQKRQEIYGEFLEDELAVFKTSDIQACIDETLPSFTNPEGYAEWLPSSPVRQASSLSNPSRFTDGWDLAKHLDWTVGITLSVGALNLTPLRLVAFERFQKLPWQVVYHKIRQRHEKFQSEVLIDSTGLGDVVLDEIKDIAKGKKFTPREKTDMLLNLQRIIEQHRLRIPFIKQLILELQTYQWEDKDLVTDCVMALALACWQATKGPRWTFKFL